MTVSGAYKPKMTKNTFLRQYEMVFLLDILLDCLFFFFFLREHGEVFIN